MRQLKGFCFLIKYKYGNAWSRNCTGFDILGSAVIYLELSNFCKNKALVTVPKS